MHTNEIRLVYVTCSLPSNQCASGTILSVFNLIYMFHISYYIYYQTNKHREMFVLCDLYAIGNRIISVLNTKTLI